MQFALRRFLDILSLKVNGQRIHRVRNSYSFTPILLKLIRCLDHALKICMWFGYNLQINFGHIFHNLNLVVFRTFTLRMCMWFGYTYSQIIFL